jgi:hypothetical protein
MTDVDEVNQLYPQCTQPGVNLEKTFVAVHAAIKGNGLGYGSAVRLTFGMALWVAIVIHIIGVEVYVRMIGVLLAAFLHNSDILNFWLSRSKRRSLPISTGVGSYWKNTPMTPMKKRA